MKSNPPSTTLRRLFSGLAEQTFQTELGVADPPLIDYISDMLIRFVRIDVVYKVRCLSGKRLQEVAEMLVEAEARVGDARREVHRHIGDFTLFWTGVYPEALSRMHSPLKKDHFFDYCEQGKRSYFIASTIETARDGDPPGEVLQRLSRHFEMCAYGLREVRRQWERREGESEAPRPFLIN